jgi:hypothetical protein
LLGLAGLDCALAGEGGAKTYDAMSTNRKSMIAKVSGKTSFSPLVIAFMSYGLLDGF